MKIVSMNVEIIRATSAVAEFLVRLELDGPSNLCEVSGRVVGPSCSGSSTVEVAYPMTPAGQIENPVSLRAVIPEPNLWRAEMPFTYAVSVEVHVDGHRTDSRSATLALRGR